VRVAFHDDVRLLDRALQDISVHERSDLAAGPELEAAGRSEGRDHDVHGVRQRALIGSGRLSTSTTPE
jgi:hypothetical protein